MSLKGNYYVYLYLREDGTPYYVGKGSGGRVYNTHRYVKCPKNKDLVVFAAQDISEEEAFQLEKTLIKQYGRKDNGTGILRNMTDGGEGNSGRVISAEHRQKVSEAQKGIPREYLALPTHIINLIKYYYSLGLPKKLIGEYLDISRTPVQKYTKENTNVA